MGRKANWPPKVEPHRGQDTIRVNVGGERRRVTLGPTGSDEARKEYLRIVSEIEASHGASLKTATSPLLSEMCLAFMGRCESEVSRTQRHRVKTALKPVLKLYGHTRAAEFGPVALAVVREAHVKNGHCRDQCNVFTSVVRQMFRWCVSVEMVGPESLAKLQTLTPLREGKCAAGETEEVRPVEQEVVERTLPHLPVVVADMTRVQLLTGMRPGEVCLLRPRDVVRPWKSFDGVQVWLFRLKDHKSRWRGKKREITIGPRAQAVLRPYLEGRGDDEYCFCPRDSRDQQYAEMRQARRSKVQPSQVNRKRPSKKTEPGERYSTGTYAQAIKRACLSRGMDHWSPNQLRHTAGTRVRADFSREDAQAVLGHSDARVTDVYAEACERAGKVAAKAG